MLNIKRRSGNLNNPRRPRPAFMVSDITTTSLSLVLFGLGTFRVEPVAASGQAVVPSRTIPHSVFAC